MEQNQKNENESKCVLELYEYCEKGLYTNIKKILEDNDFSSKTLDTAIRRCMKNRKRERNEYDDSLNLLLQYVNVNFKNPNEDNSTLIMLASRISDVTLIDIILDFDYSQNCTYKNAKIDLSIRDDLGRNLLHYMVNKDTQEEEACEVLDRFLYGGGDISEEIPECIGDECTAGGNTKVSVAVNSQCITNELNMPDNEGYTPLGLALQIGWTTISKLFLSLSARTNFLLKKDSSNLVHLAVLGKNLNCIKLVLSYSSLEDVRHKNKESLSPKELARSLKLNYYAKIIENFEENCCNPSFMNIFSQRSLLVNDILEKFYLEDYQETLFLLNQLKVSQSILATSANASANLSLNIEWNTFLTKYYIKLNLSNANEDNVRSASRFAVSPESILSKFIEGSNGHPKKTNFVSDFKDFFGNINELHISEDTKSLDIIIYNKGIYYYKMGDFIKTTQIFSNYLNRHLNVNDSMYYKWFLYVNISFILIEGLTFHKYTKLVSCIIEKIEEFLFTHIRTKKDETFTSDLIGVRDYLNNKEVINQFSSTWDESFCFVNLLKAMKSICEVKMDEAKVYMKDFKKLFKFCNYKEDVKVMRSMPSIYTCIKIKMFYFENSFSKCFKNLNKIYKLTNIEQINLRINSLKVDERFHDNEYILFYLNSMGIINLRQKKFNNAEIFFKAGVAHYKKILQLLESNRFDFSIMLNSIFMLKYNLALCLFFQKRYDRALSIFKEISKNKNMNMNVMLWYRLGLCSLEVELTEIRRGKSGRNDTIAKVFGYDSESPSKEAANANANELSSNDLNEAKDESEEIDLMDNGTVNLNFIDEEDTPAPICFRRIILQNNHTGSYGSKRKIVDAIGYFKQVLLLSSNNINCNSKLNLKNELKDIWNFFIPNSEEQFEKSSQTIKSLPLIITSTYLNLVFCLTITESWTEVLFYVDLYEKSEYYKKEKDVAYKLDNFKIEAYMNLKQTDKAIEIIKSNLNMLSLNDFRGSFFNKVNSGLYNDVSYKIVLNINLAKIHFINSNNAEAEKCISNLMIIINTPNSNTISDLPPYILNLFIYYNLLKDNKCALNFIKFRKASFANLAVNKK